MIGGKEKKSNVGKNVLEIVDSEKLEITYIQKQNASDMIAQSIEEETVRKNNNKVIQIGKFRNIYQVDYYAYFELKYYSS